MLLSISAMAAAESSVSGTGAAIEEAKSTAGGMVAGVGIVQCERVINCRTVTIDLDAVV
jgi:hypothetical protein